jgi:hypothetical protein
MLPVDDGSARDLRAAVIAVGPARQLTGLTPPPTGPTPARKLRAGDFSLLSGRRGRRISCGPPGVRRGSGYRCPMEPTCEPCEVHLRSPLHHGDLRGPEDHRTSQGRRGAPPAIHAVECGSAVNPGANGPGMTTRCVKRVYHGPSVRDDDAGGRGNFSGPKPKDKIHPKEPARGRQRWQTCGQGVWSTVVAAARCPQV